MATMAQQELMAKIGETGSLPLLGYTLSPRFTDVAMPHDELEALLTREGFDKFVPNLPTERETLRRALEDWLQERARQGRGGKVTGNANALERVRISVVNRKDRLAFIVEALTVDLRALGIKHGTALRVIFDKRQQTMFATTTDHGDISDAIAEEKQITQEIGAKWSHYRTLQTAEDLSRTVRTIITDGMSAALLRDNGGYYFVPASEAAALDRLLRVVAAMDARGEEAFLLVVPVPDVAMAKRMMAHASHTSFLQEIAAMETKFAKLLDVEPGTVRPKTVAQWLAAFRETKAKAEAYSDLLGMRQEAVQDALDSLIQRARAIVTKGATLATDGAAEDAPEPAEPAGDAPADDIPF